MNLQDQGYKQWLADLKNKIRSTQIKTAIAVNSMLIEFYWDLGKMIAEKQTEWGSKFLETLSKDLRKEFPEMQGFSVTNLKYCRLFYQYFTIGPQLEDQLKISPQPGAQLEKGSRLVNQNLTNLSNEVPISHSLLAKYPGTYKGDYYQDKGLDYC